MFGFLCRCGHVVAPIVLPQSIHEEIILRLSEKRPIFSRLHEIVACPECDQVFVGTLQNFHPAVPQILGQHSQNRRLAIQARSVCGYGTCGTPVVIHTTANVGTSDATMRLKASAWLILDYMHCGKCGAPFTITLCLIFSLRDWKISQI